MNAADTVQVTINGTTLEAAPGATIIEVADKAHIRIPRFCYHKELSVAANCRMCLVDVERAPKPLPACATPVTDGMVVRTCSAQALAAQRSVMEMLLINHPLDCPVCDQGGECELQDVAMGYGAGVSRYQEGKRAVPDPDLGPLIATDMNRCIHCTRCVRFGREIAGVSELGAVGRGEHMRITNYVEQAVQSELSGNMIDVCPVGALTAKPSRFQARAWEMQQKPSVAPHDPLGSHVHVHVRRDRLIRVVPREHAPVNGCWLSDADRFGYEGLYSPDRLLTPRVRQGSVWQDTDWDTAIACAVSGWRRTAGAHGSDELAGLIHPSGTLEEAFLFQGLIRGMGSMHVDHRCCWQDGSDHAMDPGCALATLDDVEAADVVCVWGADLRHEAPMLQHRVRRARSRGAYVVGLSPMPLDGVPSHSAWYHVHPRDWAVWLEQALSDAGSDQLSAACRQRLQAAKRPVVLTGRWLAAHPHRAWLMQVLQAWCKAHDARHLDVGGSANSQGMVQAGAVPVAWAGGRPVMGVRGDPACVTWQQPKAAYVLWGVEPEHDLPERAMSALRQAEWVVAGTAYRTAGLEQVAHVLLPLAPAYETSGTWVNAMGDWQSCDAAVAPQGAAKQGWEVLHALQRAVQPGAPVYDSPARVREAVRDAQQAALPDAHKPPDAQTRPVIEGTDWWRVARVDTCDPVLRRAAPWLERSRRAACVRLAPLDAQAMGWHEGDKLRVIQGECVVEAPLACWEGLPRGVVVLDAPIGAGDVHGPVVVQRGDT